jgi:hypothetical protein
MPLLLLFPGATTTHGVIARVESAEDSAGKAANLVRIAYRIRAPSDENIPTHGEGEMGVQ